MPTYEYECDTCGSRFEQRRGMTEGSSSEPGCPSCGAQRSRRVFSVFATGSGGGGSLPAQGGGCGCGGACACGH